MFAYTGDDRATVQVDEILSMLNNYGIDRLICCHVSHPRMMSAQELSSRMKCLDLSAKIMIEGQDITSISDCKSGLDESASVAVSDISQVYRIIEIGGPSAFDLLRRGAELDPSVASGSAIRMFRGFEIIIYPWQDFEHFRVHVSAPYFTAFWELLGQLADHTISDENDL